MGRDVRLTPHGRYMFAPIYDIMACQALTGNGFEWRQKTSSAAAEAIVVDVLTNCMMNAAIICTTFWAYAAHSPDRLALSINTHSKSVRTVPPKPSNSVKSADVLTDCRYMVRETVKAMMLRSCTIKRTFKKRSV